jgi:rhodanese-related sulfurtransferase
MVSVADLRDEMTGSGRPPQMIDVRTASEYAAGHIPCAVNIPMDQFESRRSDLRLEDGVVLVCKGGDRARIVAGWLGPKIPVRVLEGGTEAWRRERHELVSSAKTRWSLERQVRLGAGLMIVTATLLAASGLHWGIWLAMMVGAGLTFAGATDICMLAIVLAKMPWNQAKPNCAGKSGYSCCG